MAARYIDNQDGTFTLLGDNGHKAMFADPDGSYRRELDSISSSTGEIAGAPGDATAKPRGYVPETNAAFRPPPMQPMVSDMQQQLPPMPSTMPDTSNMAPPGASAQPAAPAPVRLTIPGSPGESQTTVEAPSTSTTHTSGTSTHGSSESRTIKDPDGTIAAAQGKALEAGHAANEAVRSGKQTALENSGRLIMNETLRAEAQNVTQTRIANEKEVALAAALADRKAKRQVPIDPGQAFADDGGAAAFMATMGSAITNIGLAWMGQAAQPVHIIDNLVDRSVAIQRDQKAQGIDEATETVEMTRAQMAEAKANARVAVAQQLDSQRAYVQNDNELQMLDSIYQDNEAKLARDEAEYAQAIADDVVIQKSEQATSGGTSTTTNTGGTSTTTKSGTPDTTIEIPAGSDEETAADAVHAAQFDQSASPGEQTKATELKDSVVTLNERERIYKELEELETKGGYVSDVLGLWQGGTDGVGRYDATRSPEQQRAKDLLNSLEIHNAQDSKRESNSVKRQEMQAKNMIPKNDRDLPMFFSRGKEYINERKRDMWVGYDPKVVGKVRSEFRKNTTGKVEEF